MEKHLIDLFSRDLKDTIDGDDDYSRNKTNNHSSFSSDFVQFSILFDFGSLNLNSQLIDLIIEMIVYNSNKFDPLAML